MFLNSFARFRDLEDEVMYGTWREFKTPDERGEFFERVKRVMKTERLKRKFISTMRDQIKSRSDFQHRGVRKRMVKQIFKLTKNDS